MQALRGTESCCKFTTRLVIVNRSHYSFATCQVCDEPTSGDGRDEDVEHKQPALLITSTCRSDSLYPPASGRGISMRVKSNKALRRSARLARRAPISPVVVLPAATSFPRRPGLRVGAANGMAAAVAGILWGSGGRTGVNIDVAGFPNGGGDSPYFTTMIQGAPVYGSPFLSFMDNSSFIRLDDTVERIEIVQGGTSAIFGPGQEGATANFILRTGRAERQGSVGVTYGNEGLYRVDLFQGGKVAEG